MGLRVHELLTNTERPQIIHFGGGGGGGGLVEKYCPFLKMKKKVSSRTFFRHPAGPPETEFFSRLASGTARFSAESRTSVLGSPTYGIFSPPGREDSSALVNPVLIAGRSGTGRKQAHC